MHFPPNIKIVKIPKRASIKIFYVTIKKGGNKRKEKKWQAKELPVIYYISMLMKFDC